MYPQVSQMNRLILPSYKILNEKYNMKKKKTSASCIFENDNLFMFIAFRCYDTNEAKGSCIFQFRVIFS